ncbi:hypothetical protein KIL84_000356 [Mauremys mutica]|uniref:Uncharacterized protein n=1 Tax=Mauremys mutica TaxID=74926 RepID=A0A9D4B3M6_9SAUR|nr:hypothetical protein KIL84_000356 [Mauremys mutica]
MTHDSLPLCLLKSCAESLSNPSGDTGRRALERRPDQAHLVQMGRAIPPSVGEVAVNSTILGTDSQLQLDIVITNEDGQKIIMVDVIVPFENRTPEPSMTPDLESWRNTPLWPTP